MQAALQFPRGNIYQIICKAHEEALKIQEQNPSSFHKSRIVGCKPDSNDNSQLFMVEKIGSTSDSFEIVNCISTLVFDQESNQIRLKRGKQNSDQLFAMVPAKVQGFYNYFWIKTSSNEGIALRLEGILRYGQFDPNDETQLFRLQEVSQENYLVSSSSILINHQSGKAIDIPEASFEKGERLVQWEKNKRFNQRWRFRKEGQGFVIQSILNNMAIDIDGASKDSGSKIIQWEHNGGSNQHWYPEKSENGVYKLRSCHEHSLFLSVKNCSVDDGAYLEVTNVQNPSIYWKILGAEP